MNRSAFTMIELLTVMVITGIIAVTALPAISSLSNTRREAAAKEVVRDLTFARQHAQATGTTTWVLFNPNTDSWQVLSEDAGNPGHANAQAIIHPGTGSAYETVLDAGAFLTVTLVSVDFDGHTHVGFDWMGRPLSDDDTPLDGEGTVMLSGDRIVRVEAGTGLVR